MTKRDYACQSVTTCNKGRQRKKSRPAQHALTARRSWVG